MSRIRLRTALAFLVHAFLCGTQAFADPLYTITNLSAGAPEVQIDGFNNLGQTVGYVVPGLVGRQGYAFIYNGSPGGSGTVTPLGGSLATSNYPAVRDTLPTGINDSGQVIGSTSNYATAQPETHAYYVYSNGQTTNLPFEPISINNSGQVLGTVETANSSQFVYSAVVYNLSTASQQVLGSFPGTTQSQAVAMNDAGQVVANTYTWIPAGNNFSPVSHPFLYSNGKMIDMGTLGGPSATAIAMNNSGQVVGESTPGSGSIQHAFLYANGTMTDLGVLPGYVSSVANSINSQGQVVGYMTTTGIQGDWGNGAGFLYSNGVMTNLNSLINPSSGWTIEDPFAINNLGQILAYATNGSKLWEVLLTPSDESAPGDPVYPTIVPEPSSLAIYGLVAAGLALRFQRLRQS